MIKKNVYDITRFGVLTALALALAVTENLFFPNSLFPVPGMRLGLSNIVTLLVICLYGPVPAFAIVLGRSLLAFAFGGNLTAFVFSLVGGIAALLTMTLFCRFRRFSLFGISMAGAAAHNIGQIIAAAVLTKTLSVAVYLPLLLLTSLFTGLLVAFLAIPVYHAVSKIRYDGS
jgi:heptaprenyl diphosphate synthase